MEKMQKFINIFFLSCLLMPITLFIFPPTFAIADGAKGASYLYEFGGLVDWLTVSSNVGNKSGFIEVFFYGNTGVTIHWFSVFYNFFMIFVFVYMVVFIGKRLYLNTIRKQHS